ncbi:MAG: glycosyltransferase family 4 protein [Candidatus Omnitrophota bacterium]|nr:glycosyltransferase family 4 protein [Candidatus Omnitrophota bacterium]MDZ4243255.1 glycosyltransferase family 4 protein [Candidatus Omnitrophota bacterium]
MNILLTTTHVNTGGITSYLLTLSRGLVLKGHGVWLASSGGNQEADFAACGVRCLTENIRTKSELNPKIYLTAGKLRLVVREQNISVVHAHTRVTQVMAACLKKMTGTPFVSTCHGFFKPRLFRRLFPLWGDRVIAISPQVREHLAKDFRVAQDRIALVPNGIDVDSFVLPEGRRREARAAWGLQDNQVIGIIARLSDVKGHDVLIKAMPAVLKKVPAAVLMIVGVGREEEVLRSRVKALGLEQKVRFHPSVNRTREFLTGFDVFVMPSLQEGLGLSVMEAQAAGLAVVASRVGGLPSLIEDGRTGRLVPPGDEAALAEAIAGLLQDPARAAAFGSAAREFIRKNFSAEQMVEKTLDVYRSVDG